MVSSPSDTKEALAKLVLPETLEDIEEFLKPEFPPRKHPETTKGKTTEGDPMRRRIVMDGHGRWREVRPGEIRYKDLRLVNSRNLSEMKEMFGMQSSPMVTSEQSMFQPQKDYPKAFPIVNSRYQNYNENGTLTRKRSGQAVRSESSSSGHGWKSGQYMYDHLGMATRSNVFPGLGNFHWNTTTSKAFTEKAVTSVKDRHKFFGIQTDDFGQWSAANVYHERMKKAWEEYLASAPKATENWKPPEPRVLQSIVKETTKPPSKSKKNPPKPKPPKTDRIVTPPPNPLQEQPQSQGPQSKPPPNVPVDNGDEDGFWDFYDKAI